ncbi:MAG: zf-TFIIB domain-containing protein [Pseudomonadota bacterium]
MPLISSPIDGSPMREIERYGVKIDICQTSGGIWLDKGELEKIIMMIREEALQDGGGHAAPGADVYDDDDEYDRGESGTYQQRPRRRKRESVFENLMDIFDM